ncbi:hypothetical protein FB567DRAFT_592567 [Paraphoma chrysanthemicola]|uniref:F-box domain-containing protein n=1 Tax=Paraphoma chrysanthemicola TaxID=798071 RepID=A0A8K0VY05_9PLEO|nr:hypothetical protein FB567DRAFT_592567 [Paraphoma chrysanthemicola]
MSISLGTGIDTISKVAISDINRWKSPLLRLPAELRNEIFTHLLNNLEIRMSYSQNKYMQIAAVYRPLDHPEAIWRPATHLTAITATCRQLRAETRYLLFTFDNAFSGQSGWCLEVLLKRLSEEQRRLAGLHRFSPSYGRAGEGFFLIQMRG